MSLQELGERCHKIEYAAVTIASTVVFLYFLVRLVFRELGR